MEKQVPQFEYASLYCPLPVSSRGPCYSFAERGILSFWEFAFLLLRRGLCAWALGRWLGEWRTAVFWLAWSCKPSDSPISYTMMHQNSEGDLTSRRRSERRFLTCSMRLENDSRCRRMPLSLHREVVGFVNRKDNRVRHWVQSLTLTRQPAISILQNWARQTTWQIAFRRNTKCNCSGGKSEMNQRDHYRSPLLNPLLALAGDFRKPALSLHYCIIRERKEKEVACSLKIINSDDRSLLSSKNKERGTAECIKRCCMERER